MSFESKIREALAAIGTDIATLKTGGTSGPSTSAIKPLIPSSLLYPITISHRCAPNVYPEASAEGFQAALDSGFFPEFDLQRLADGTLVVCHDATWTRTMLGLTGAAEINTKTQADWRAARIKPAIPGAVTGRPLFWRDVLDTWGGRVPMVPELKQGDTSMATEFVNDIVSRGLQRCVIAQSFDYAICKQVAAAGIPVIFLSSAPPTQTPATLKTDKIEFICMSNDNAATTTAAISSYKAQGIKVLLYTINDLEDQARAMSKGADGVFSNDPWLTTESIPWRNKDEFDKGIRPLGSVGYLYDGTGTTRTEPTGIMELRAGRELGFKQNSDATKMNTNVTYIPAIWAGPITRNMTISGKLRFGAGSGTNLTYNMGFCLSNQPGGLFKDAPRAGQNAYALVIRRNGQLQGWHYTNGADAVSMGSTTAQTGTGAAPIGVETVIDFNITLTATQIILNASGGALTGGKATLTLTNSLVIDPCWLTLRYPNASGGWISDVSVIEN